MRFGNRTTSSAKGRDGRVNRQIDPLVEIVAGEAITAQTIDRISRNGRRNYGNTALIELTSHLERHFGRGVVNVINTSNVENETMYGFFCSGYETKNLFDEKVGICIKQIGFKTVDNDAERRELVRNCWHGTPMCFAIF